MKKLPKPTAAGTQNLKLKTQKLDDATISAPPVLPTAPPPGPAVPVITSSPVDEPTGSGLAAKEREILARNDEIQLEEIRKELELAPEVEETGVEVKPEKIELPPPVQQMGVTASDVNQPVVSQPTVTVLLSDEKIVNNSGGSIWASLTWLANWCLKQLKKVHVQLKKVHGRIVRIVTK